MNQRKTAVVLGDSFNNTLGLIRSLGEADVRVILLLVGNDRLFVANSKYVDECININKIEDCEITLNKLGKDLDLPFLICTNDIAAKWVDENEDRLSKLFVTPMRGLHLGSIFDKLVQCKIAEDFGIRIPRSVIFRREECFPKEVEFPILLKPANSYSGEKSDIHICSTSEDLQAALEKKSECKVYIVQEFINKDYEVNLIGISTDNDVIIPGGIKKIRHYPTVNSPCSFGLFLSTENFNIEIESLKNLIKSIGYRGPFSAEFLIKDGKSYFMEINFRHDGLAYTATKSGVNLLDLYINGIPKGYKAKVIPTYMMDLSIDFCHVKNRNLSLNNWLNDFNKTKCQLNFNCKDPKPTLLYYCNKIKNIINKECYSPIRE